MPIFLQCDRCTACCRWPGQVSLNATQITQLAAYLQLSEDEFIQEYTRLNRTRTGLALKDQADGSCVFLDGDDCRVNSVKPQQCRDFPNLWNFPGSEQHCRARPIEVTPDDWRRRIKLATGRDVEPGEVEGRKSKV